LTVALVKEVDAKAKLLHVPRAEYVRLAISRMNREVTAEERRKRLRACAEFDLVEYGCAKAK
jgi:hypothetical protein